MPEIKIKHLVSFSSEDKVHKAENILKPESYRKWKCASPGEKNASVVLQFEKATKIHSIDIGNECSAFVEVLVGRSSNSVNDFQVLLVASSFMSPLESKNENHTNRVRMFDSDKLSQNVKDEKWDCVQVVCTQPFNKNITYGLSFIKFHSPPEKIVEQPPETETKTATTKLGAFQLKYDDDEDITSSPGLSWKKNKESLNSGSLSKPSSQEEPSFAAAVLASSNQSKSEKSEMSEYEKRIAKNKQEQKDFIKALKIQEAGKEFAEAVKEFKGNSAAASKKLSSPSLGSTPLREKNKRVNSPRVNPLKRSSESKDLLGMPPKKKEFVQKASTSNKVAKVEKKRPFHKIMDKVVFVISGFVNPMRSEIRDKALEMGAKYKGDWDRTCTHLVCAFINTPKYLQVRGDDGRVVTKEWVMDCYKRKALLPWRSYMLGKYSRASSEEEPDSDEGTSVAVAKRDSPKTNGNHLGSQKPVKRRAKIASSSSDSDEAPTPSKQQKPKLKSLFGDINEKDTGDSKPGPSTAKPNKPKPKIASSDSDSAEEKTTVSKQQISKPKSLFGDLDEIDASDQETNGEETLKRGPISSAGEGSETEDEEAIRDYLAATDVESDSGGDTEDEIRKVEQAQKKKLARATPSSPPKDNSDSNDSISLLSSKPDTTDVPLPELPNLFKQRHFYLYGEFSQKKYHDLRRFITVYNGIVADYMGDEVKYVVTEEGWDKNFEDALEENEDLIFVKPDWIFKCHEAQKLIPYQAYIVIPC